MPQRRTLFAGAAAAAAGATGLIAATRTASAQETLRAAADALGKDIGVAVDVNKLQNDSQYASTIAAEFNSLTAENAMKWDAVQPSRGQFNFGSGDAIVDFAEANGPSRPGRGVP